MNYEKAYKGALERAKYLKENTDNVGAKDISYSYEYIFPELKESEDERIRREIMEYITSYKDSLDDDEYRTWISWLEKQGEQKPEENKGNIGGISPNWSEEDEKLYNSALWHIKNSCGNGGNDSGEYEVYNWLKSIKDRVQPQPKQEWSEDDEKMLDSIIDCLDGLCFIDSDQLNWLKSIKPNHWKPSKFQLECLKKVIPHNNTEKGCELEDVLTELYTELKRL